MMRIEGSDLTSLIARTANTFNVKTLAGTCTMASNSTSRCFPYLATTTNTSYEIGTGSPLIQSSVSSFTYDTWGNATVAMVPIIDSGVVNSVLNRALSMRAASHASW